MPLFFFSSVQSLLPSDERIRAGALYFNLFVVVAPRPTCMLVCLGQWLLYTDCNIFAIFENEGRRDADCCQQSDIKLHTFECTQLF